MNENEIIRYDDTEYCGEDHDTDEYEEYEEVEVDLSRSPAYPVSPEEVQYGIFISDLLLKCGLSDGDRESRELIENGGILVNGEEVPKVECILTEEDFWEGYVTVEKYAEEGRFIVLDL